MKWFIIAPLLILILFVGIGVYLQPNDFRACDVKPVDKTACDKADAIVVVSGGDTVARTTAGIELYKNGWGDHLIFSGAASDKTGPSNALAMRRQAEAAGVPKDAIQIDETSLNTQQNAANTRSIVKDSNFHDIILVTSGYHQRRASLEFKKLADDTIVRNYPVINDKDWSFWWWLTPRGWWLAGSELIKIGAFYIGVSQ